MPRALVPALALAIGQLRDPAIVRVLVKSLLITLAAFVAIGTAIWFGLDAVLDRYVPAAGSGWEWVLTIVLTVALGWVLWRVVAVAVLQFFADEVVEAVELRYYPGARATARKLSFAEELAVGWRGARRAILFNLAALPFELALAFTGVGSPLVFWAVNAVLLGRELTELVWLRHATGPNDLPPLSQGEQIALGGACAALFVIPVVNLLAPVLSAATATHCIHRRGELAHAR